MYNVLKILKEILRIFENFVKFYWNFRENLWKNLDNLEICIGRGFGGPSSPNLTKLLKKLVEKINENLQDYESFHEFLANFYLES